MTMVNKITHAYYDMCKILKFLRINDDTNKNLQQYEERFGPIPEDAIVEEMPFYKDFLSKFNTKKTLCGLPLKWNKSDFIYYRDADLMQRLVYGSINANYQLDYDKDSNSYELSIIGSPNNKWKLHELNYFDYGRLVRFFINEMLVMENIKYDDVDGGRQWVEEQREIRLKHFEQQTERLLDQMEGKSDNIVILPLAKMGREDNDNAYARKDEGAYYKIIDGKSFIPIGETAIPNNAFKSNRSLESVFIPASVKRIGRNAFDNCKALHTVVIPPDSVRMIGNSAFSFCTSLKNISLPESVNRICTEAFYGCGALESIVIPDSVTQIMDRTFYSCGNLKSASIGRSVTAIRDSAFNNCKSLEKIIIHEGVTTIGKRAFMDCVSLKTMDLPKSLTEIKSMAFERCESLTTIVIPDSVVKIGNWVFADCIALEKIMIRDASLLKHANVPEGVEIVEKA